MSVISLLNQVKNGDIVLPNIQRNFVWSEEMICKLMDSIMRGYPIGIILMWETYLNIQFRKFTSSYTEEVNFDYSQNESETKKLLVLDGQQRLQSLFIALYGKYHRKQLYFELLSGQEKDDYKNLYHKYDGNKIIDDTTKFLENYKRIVRLIGDSFPDTGMEILLHNLTNPSKALYHIKNNVTGRNIDAPATNLVHDLKMRGMQNQDKLNYELNIGSRKFKCTTIPIYRAGYGLVGAICINVDYHYINEEVRRDEKKLNSFINSICKTDMILDENILSEDEYKNALAGKRHFRDY